MTEGLLLYDGTCGFCASSVQWILRRDRRRTLRFAALQGETARSLRARHPELAGVDSMVLVQTDEARGEERILVRSDAAVAVGWYLGGGWGTLATIGAGVPRGLRDPAYDVIARHRQKIIRSGPECLVPTPEERKRFLP